jgi:two-component system sensor histidine kinase BaeS
VRTASGRGGRSSLAVRTALATTAAAVVACLVAGVVSYVLLQRAAQRQERVELGRIADIASQDGDFASLIRLATGPAGAVGGSPAQVRARLKAAEERIAAAQRTAILRGTHIALVGVLRNGTTVGQRAGLVPASAAAAVAVGRSVNIEITERGRPYFIQGRALPHRIGGVVFLEPVSDVASLTTPLLHGIEVALLVGLAVAALVGSLLARRLARPLADAAGAAHRLAAGEREVRLVPAGPAEVAEVAESLNTLAEALAASEGRQRQFLLSISHELRTPLTGIKGFAEALADGVTVGDAVPGAGAVVLDEAIRLERLVSDLLDLARLGAQDFRIDLAPVDLGDLIAQAAEVWQPRCAREGVPLGVESAGAPVVVTDAGRVRQIIDGLAENALRVVPAGTPLVFAVGSDDAGGWVEVRDGGPGLTEDDCAVAFERSALTDRYRGIRRVGTGVGLALVGALAARLGGRAVAGRAPEGGARFTVWLPAQGPTS